MLKKTIEGVLAGIMIAIGGSVYVASSDKVVGSVFFSVALLTICMKGYSLFTGKVGFIPLSHKKEDISALLWGLFGNLIGTVVCGLLVATALPKLHTASELIAATKLSQTFTETLIRAFFCGVLMYAAVSIFRDHKSSLGIFFCVPTFILAGFEHSIADMFYLALGHSFDVKSLLFILTVLLGNALGAMAMTSLRLLGEKSEKKSQGEPEAE